MERFTFRFATTRDVDAVNQMLFDEYGSDYPYPMSPSSFVDEHISLLCELGGEAVAFARAAWYGTAYELGRLIIRPAFRGNGVARALTQCRLTLIAGRSKEHDLVFSEPVCHRVDHASQQNLLNFGFQHTGVQVAKYPGIIEDRLGRQPESVTMAFKRLNNALDGHRPICVPDDYGRLLADLLGRPLTNGSTALDGAAPEPVSHKPIMVRGIAGTEFLDLPVNWLSSRAAIECARSRGFVLSGLLPGMGRQSDGTRYDLLRMQRLPSGLRPDFGLVHVTPDLLPFLTHIRRELQLA